MPRTSTLSLSLDPHLGPREAEEVVAAVKRITGVSDAGLIDPHSKAVEVRSMGYAVLESGQDTDAVAKALIEIQGVVSCDVPSRKLAI